RLIEEYQNQSVTWHSLDQLIEANQANNEQTALIAPKISICIAGGKKDKLRPGDILGALTGDVGISKDQVGKINVFEFMSYVAVDRDVIDVVMRKLANCNIKGRQFKIREIT
ncbi:MAG: DbpA RNA binding domain-containing protein, partial [Candidatus Aquirickettsiella gammari]